MLFRELCDRMRFEVDCAKSHHRVISEGLNLVSTIHKRPLKECDLNCKNILADFKESKEVSSFCRCIPKNSILYP